MSTEDDKATVRRFVEEDWNQGHVALIDELLAPNFILHVPTRPDVSTREDLKRLVTESQSTFPDFHLKRHT